MPVPSNDLYEASVAMMVLGGWAVTALLLGWAGIVTFIARPANRGEATGRSLQKARDGGLALGVAAIPQVLICLIPILYKSPRDAPVALSEGCLLCGVIVLILWLWALAKLLSAKARPSGWMWAPLLIPFLATIPALIGVFLIQSHSAFLWQVRPPP